jgi:hypothetical protein
MFRDARDGHHDPLPAAESDLAETVLRCIIIGNDLAHADILAKPSGEVQIRSSEMRSKQDGFVKKSGGKACEK